MAAIAINTNLDKILTSLGESIAKLSDKEYLLRPVAVETLPLITQRIHQDGRASDGSPIGSYSNSYLRTREKNHRGSDTKIIVSLTRQLENDWAVTETARGYGIGFTNPFNADKMRFVEEQKGKQIAALTDSEIDFAFIRLLELTDDAING